MKINSHAVTGETLLKGTLPYRVTYSMLAIVNISLLFFLFSGKCCRFFFLYTYFGLVKMFTFPTFV